MGPTQKVETLANNFESMKVKDLSVEQLDTILQIYKTTSRRQGGPTRRKLDMNIPSETNTEVNDIKTILHGLIAKQLDTSQARTKVAKLLKDCSKFKGDGTQNLTTTIQDFHENLVYHNIDYMDQVYAWIQHFLCDDALKQFQKKRQRHWAWSKVYEDTYKTLTTTEKNKWKHQPLYGIISRQENKQQKDQKTFKESIKRLLNQNNNITQSEFLNNINKIIKEDDNKNKQTNHKPDKKTRYEQSKIKFNKYRRLLGSTPNIDLKSIPTPAITKGFLRLIIELFDRRMFTDTEAWQEDQIHRIQINTKIRVDTALMNVVQYALQVNDIMEQLGIP